MEVWLTGISRGLHGDTYVELHMRGTELKVLEFVTVPFK